MGPANGAAHVTGPEGLSWDYALALWAEGSIWVEELTMTTPHGGTVKYRNQEFWIDWENEIDTYMITKRTAGGRDIPAGEWVYQYALDGEVSMQTIVTSPGGTRITYVFNSSNRLTSRTVEKPVGTTLETESRTYQNVPIRISGHPGVSEVATRTITRNGRSYATQYVYSSSNYGDYHRPSQIIEDGDLDRKTVFTYSHTESPYIVGLLEEETVCLTTGGSCTGPSFTKTWDYNANGFVTSQTIYGIQTTFTPTAQGNVATMTHNGKTTSFAYSYGLAGTITLPLAGHVITRSIDPTGVILSESRAGRTTTFTYDNLFRPRFTYPPGGTTAIETQYDSAGAWVKVLRGPSWTTTTLDGYGRPIATENSVGAKRRATYNGEGQMAYQSYAFDASTAEVGTTITYDGLGRVTRQTHPDGNYVEYTHGSSSTGLTVTIRDENNHLTVREVQGFGAPEEWLTKVTDADAQPWTYSYNALGSLTGVTPPSAPGWSGSGPMRTWTYDASNRLESEFQPESGTSSAPYYSFNYTYVPGTTLVATKTDAKGTVFTYGYDDNGRLTSITAHPTSGPDRVTTITYEPGTDNRASASVTGGASTTWTYEAATGRLSQRTDVVNSTTFTQSFLYNSLDQLTTLTYPAPTTRQVSYQYNSEGRPTLVSTGSIYYASAFVYHPSGAVKQYTDVNGLVHQFAYDTTRHRLQSISAGNLGLTYGYDPAGNVTAITDARANKNQTFTYDALDRVRNQTTTGDYPLSCYSYDARGKRQLGSCVTSYTYDANERLTAQSGVGNWA